MKITVEREQKQTGLILPSVSNLRNAVAKTKFLSVLAITAILFASCGNDDEVTTEVNDGRVQFSSGVNAAMPKVGGDEGDTWDGGERIGIYMVGSVDGFIKEGAENIGYTAGGSGSTVTFNPIATPIYYPVDATQKVDFIAYHPYNASVSNYVYPVNVSDQSNQSAIDLMVAKTNTGYDKTNVAAVNLNFSHQLAKVVIKVIPGEGITDLTELAVKMTGMNTTADFDITGTTIANADNTADITPYKQPSAYTYEAILLPVTFGSAHVVEFALGGDTYKWIMSQNSTNILQLVAGNKYTFDVLVTKNRIFVDGTITPWTPQTGSGTAQ